MTDKVQKIREEVERLCNAGLHNSTISKKDVLNTILAVVNDFKEEPVSIWHDSGEMPKEKKVCLIRYSANDGASTNNFEVVIAESLTRRFVTRSYPHKTGYQHTIHGENTIKVDEYQDRREYIPFSDIDEWAYIDDLLNLSNVQRIVKNWEEPVSEDLEQEIEECNSNLVPTRSRTILKKKFENCAKHFAKWKKQQILKRLCNHANIDQMVEKFEDKYKPEKVLDTEYYKRGIFDTIKAIKED